MPVDDDAKVSGSVFTIGYEGLVQAQMLDILEASGVRTVLDVRAVPQSRKAGFSRSSLSASLTDRGIAYVPDRRLGTPKPGREAARAGRLDDLRQIFGAHMTGAAAQEGLGDAVALACATTVCLLCFEREPHACHRSIVAEMIHHRTGLAIRHL